MIMQYDRDQYSKGYKQGAEDMEKAKQIIIDKLLEQIGHTRADTIDEIKKILPQTFCNYCDQIACDGGRVGSIQECTSVRMLIDTLFELEEQLKEK